MHPIASRGRNQHLQEEPDSASSRRRPGPIRPAGAVKSLPAAFQQMGPVVMGPGLRRDGL